VNTSGVSLIAQWLQSNRIRAVDHGLASSLKRLRPDTPDSVAALIAALSYAHGLGHTALPLNQLSSLWQETIFAGIETTLQDALIHSPWRATDHQAGLFVLQDDSIALQRFWQYEQHIANALMAKITSAPLSMSDALTRYWQDLFSDNAHETQALAAKRSYEHQCLLLTGGPGTGKTTVLGKLLAMLSFEASRNHRAMPRIALAAPTGKAAMRMTEALHHSVAKMAGQGILSDPQRQALSLRASTLHRLLGYQPHSVQFNYGAENLLPIDVLVIDEVSMVDIPLLSKTLQALPLHARLIMIGDISQLPSVEMGQGLRDMHAAFSSEPRLHPYHVHLDYIYRQREALDISSAANFVRDGDVENFMLCCQAATQGIEWQADKAVFIDVLRARALNRFQSLVQADSLENAFAMSKRFRVLCASRDDAFGVVAINHFLANAIKTDATARFFKGQCLMITANQAREQLFNGDLGLCWPDQNGDLCVWFETANGLQSWLPSALPAHEDAYAITIHKAQGSEFDDILLVLPDAEHPVLTRELLYTGLTRAKQSIYLWASTAALRTAIATPTLRWTNLTRMIKNSLHH
jgi:exodeoxyribonuclease V alpha subunit